MTGLFSPQQPLHPLQRLIGSDSFWLIQQHQAIQLALYSRYWFRSAHAYPQPLLRAGLFCYSDWADGQS
jgi:hypothetical protein